MIKKIPLLTLVEEPQQTHQVATDDEKKRDAAAALLKTGTAKKGETKKEPEEKEAPFVLQKKSIHEMRKEPKLTAEQKQTRAELFARRNKSVADIVDSVDGLASDMQQRFEKEQKFYGGFWEKIKKQFDDVSFLKKLRAMLEKILQDAIEKAIDNMQTRSIRVMPVDERGNLMRPQEAKNELMAGSSNVQVQAVVTPVIFSSLVGGSKALVTPGSAETLVAVPTACKKVMITPLANNANIIYYGASDVNAQPGTEKGMPLAGLGVIATVEIDDVSKIYIDVIQAGDGVAFTYFN